MKRNTISALVLNQPGTLIKLATVISGRGINIEELTAAPADDPGLTRVVITFFSGDDQLRQVRGQFEKMEVVRHVELI